MGHVVVLQPIVDDAQQEAEEQGNLRASAWFVSPREPRRGSPLPVHLSEQRRGLQIYFFLKMQFFGGQILFFVFCFFCVQ